MYSLRNNYLPTSQLKQKYVNLKTTKYAKVVVTEKTVTPKNISKQKLQPEADFEKILL